MTGAKKELGLAAYSEAIYPRFHFGWSDLRALTSGRFKYVAAPQPELYDLQQDPGETHNIYPERQALGDRMNQELIALEQRMSATAAPRRRRRSKSIPTRAPGSPRSATSARS